MKMKCYIDSQARCSLKNAVCFIPTAIKTSSLPWTFAQLIL